MLIVVKEHNGQRWMTMPARTGQEYIKGLRDRPREVWIDGELVEDVTTHPAFRGGVKSIAALYDMQHDAALRGPAFYPTWVAAPEATARRAERRPFSPRPRTVRAFPPDGDGP